MISPSDELRDLAARTAEPVQAVVERYTRAVVSEWSSGSPASDERAKAWEAAADLFGRMLAFSDLLGRRRMNMLWKAAEKKAPAGESTELALRPLHVLAATPRTPLLPVIEFEQATNDVLTREPEIAVGYEAVQELYRTQHAFACAKSMSVVVTSRVQQAITEDVRGGSKTNTADLIAQLGGWSRSYADTVYATNLRTAYTAGQWARVADADVRQVLPAMRFRSALLPTSRPNHVAAHNLLAGIDSPIWENFSPPLGYNCSCGLDEVTVYELERMHAIAKDGTVALVFPRGFHGNAFPDPGFSGGRPDRRVAFGALA